MVAVKPVADIWFEQQGGRSCRPSWILRGDCVVTDTSDFCGSGQLFVAGRDCQPIDVHFTDDAGGCHDLIDAGVVEIRWDPSADRCVRIYVHEPSTRPSGEAGS